VFKSQDTACHHRKLKIKLSNSNFLRYRYGLPVRSQPHYPTSNSKMKMIIKRSFCFVILLALSPCVSAFSPQHSHVAFSSSKICSSRNAPLAMATDPETKETTWDRITGPKLFKTVTNWQGIHSVPLVPLRILTGLLMIHHGSEGQ
jgi:hypothetical protein